MTRRGGVKGGSRRTRCIFIIILCCVVAVSIKWAWVLHTAAASANNADGDEVPGWKQRAIRKIGGDPHTCSCRLAKKAKIFSDQLDRELARGNRNSVVGINEKSASGESCVMSGAKSLFKISFVDRNGKQKVIPLLPQISLGRSGSQFEISVDPKDKMGAPCTRGAEFLRVTLSMAGKALPVPCEAPSIDGVVRCRSRTLPLPMIATYKLTVDHDGDNIISSELKVDVRWKTGKVNIEPRTCMPVESAAPGLTNGFWENDSWTAFPGMCTAPQIGIVRGDAASAPLLEQAYMRRAHVRNKALKHLKNKHILFVGGLSAALRVLVNGCVSKPWKRAACQLR